MFVQQNDPKPSQINAEINVQEEHELCMILNTFSKCLVKSFHIVCLILHIGCPKETG